MARPTKCLLGIFLLSLMLVTPYLRGDGIGYYAYVASLVIDRDMEFEDEYRHADPAHYWQYFNEDDEPREYLLTSTGHLQNIYAVGPSVMWAPAVIAAHVLVTTYNMLTAGNSIPADGYSWPYLYLAAFTTALLGFVGLLLSYRVAESIAGPWSAFWAVIGLWFASGLPVYMYFLPFMSHAHSSFAAALFVWYWWKTYPDSTCDVVQSRKLSHWIGLGVLGGLLAIIYYVNAVLWVFVLFDWLGALRKLRQGRHDLTGYANRIGKTGLAFVAGLTLGITPHLVLKAPLYGSPFSLGYAEAGYGFSFWNAPRLFEVLFSARHGLWLWTPVIMLACVGFVPLIRRNPALGWRTLAAFMTFWYIIAAYDFWHGASSFSNRFFLSLTPLFIIGLAALLHAVTDRAVSGMRIRPRMVRTLTAAVVLLLAIWNTGFIFQWGTNIIPNREPVSLAQVAVNQVTVVPARLRDTARRFLTERQDVMSEIELQDLQELD